MPSKNMLPKGKRRQSVRADYRAARDVATEAEQQRKLHAEAELYGETATEVPANLLASEGKVDASQPAPPARAVPVPRRTKTFPARKPARERAPQPLANPEVLADPKADFLSRGKTAPGVREETPAPRDSYANNEDESNEHQGNADVRTLTVAAADRDVRLDQYLTRDLTGISRSRVQLLIDDGQVEVNGRVEKPRYRVQPGDTIRVTGQPQPPPLHATPEDIPLTILYEDDDLAVIDKPAGMAVHAGSGATDDARNGGTLVNALLHHYRDALSGVGGPLRPGIVHRLDKGTSGLILIAKHDRAHRALAGMFHEHTLTKRYIALVHRIVRNDNGTIDLAISRDPVRRTRMTTRTGKSTLTTASHGRPSLRHPEEPDEDDAPSRRGREARDAVSHYTVLERLHTSAGDFTLLDVEIETGRTHQIRVHMQALGHPVVGDTVYGAPARLRGLEDAANPEAPALARNFLHAAHLSLAHPITGAALELDSPLPAELEALLDRLRSL